MPDRERDVESYLSKALTPLGLAAYKFIPDNRIGMPDRLITLPDERVIWVETKTKGGHLSVVQQLRHRELQQHGQRVVTVWTKKDVDKLVTLLHNELGEYDLNLDNDS